MLRGRKVREPDPVHVVDGVRTTALIIETEDPIDDTVIPHGDNVDDTATTRILADLGGTPTLVVQELLLVPDHWLVVGMHVPVTIDQQPPHAYEIDWDAIPTMQQRATASDPTLTDPVGTRRAVSEALVAAGFPGIDMLHMPAAAAAAESPAQAQQLELVERDFAEQVTAATALPAPAGKIRAVVLIAANAASFKRWEFGGANDHEMLTTTRLGRHSAVLSVHVPGQTPYAVFVEQFQHEKRAGDSRSPGLPALVSTTDPDDVEVLWQEVPKDREQRAAGRAMGKAANRAADGLEERIHQQAADALAGATPPPVPAAGASPVTGMDRATLTESGRTALKFIADPAQRQLIIDQYRTMGIELE
jgi:hypothetical protein